MSKNPLIWNERSAKNFKRHAGSDFFEGTLKRVKTERKPQKSDHFTETASNRDTAKEHLLTHDGGTGPELS